MAKLSVIVALFADAVEEAHQVDTVNYTVGAMALPLEERLQRRLDAVPVALRNGNATDLRAKCAELGALLASIHKAAENIIPEKQLSLPEPPEDDDDDEDLPAVELPSTPKGSPRARPEVVR